MMNKRTSWVLPILGLTLVGCELSGTLGVESPGGGDGWVIPANDKPGDPVVVPGEIDPGRVTIHRLNRSEYNNTMRDLLGDTTQPARTFPEDDFGYGFNNIADVLSVSPLHIESYFNAAIPLIDTALDQGAAASITTRFEAEDVGGSVGAVSGGAWNLYSNGEVTQITNFPAAGDYIIRVRAWQTAGGPDAAAMGVLLNGTNLELIDVPNLGTDPGVFEVQVTTPAGDHAVGVSFTNDFYDPAIPADRNLLVDWFEVEGPIGVTTGAAATRAAIVPCDTAGPDAVACARQVIETFGKRAWRRPLETNEVDRLAQFIDLAVSEGDNVETGLRLALRAILISPHFVYRVEIDPDPTSATARPLNDYELASRLSYFLWSSMPDDELTALADEGKLQDDDVLAAQVIRMLDDPKSIALIDNFAAQWLYVDAVLNSAPDYLVFPTFSAELAQDMRQESRMFVKDLIDTNASIRDLILADYTFINPRLADHYGVAGLNTDGFVRHQWTDDSRRGLLGHASILTATSHSTITSPVLRGQWVLENLWCEGPPPAPPGIPPLTNPGSTEGKTLREQLEAHALEPTCNACHRVMDPIGFGMENYDGVGAWRDVDNGLPVDSSGVLPPDTAFNGPRELADILAASPKLAYCATEKAMTYALGRGVERWDKPQIDAIIRETTEQDFRFRDIFTAIVLSDAFRMRRGGELQN